MGQGHQKSTRLYEGIRAERERKGRKSQLQRIVSNQPNLDTTHTNVTHRDCPGTEHGTLGMKWGQQNHDAQTPDV